MRSAINTKQVRTRVLSFSTVAAVRVEVERLVAAEAQGCLRLKGNWSLGTILGHLAFWVEAIDQDKGVRLPWFVILFGPLIRRNVLRGPTKVGLRIPGVKTGTYGDEPMDVAPALARYRVALDRLERGGFPARHEAFGALTSPEWLTLHLRHAQIHLAFADVEGG